jgi:hypothetical protein
MNRWILVLAFCVLAAAPALASGKVERESLSGLDGVDVTIERLDDDAKAAGLEENRLRTAVELKLRQSGVRVFTQAESLKTNRMAGLIVS